VTAAIALMTSKVRTDIFTVIFLPNAGLALYTVKYNTCQMQNQGMAQEILGMRTLAAAARQDDGAPARAVAQTFESGNAALRLAM
jgi:hypothetical protein